MLELLSIEEKETTKKKKKKKKKGKGAAVSTPCSHNCAIPAAAGAKCPCQGQCPAHYRQTGGRTMTLRKTVGLAATVITIEPLA